jgi:predicted nucleotidyltransferase
MINTKTELIRLIHTYAPGCKIMLFGSRARGSHADGADFDIAIDAGSKLPHTTMLQISNAIEESNIPVRVDIIDLHNVSERFLTAIKKDLIIWAQN